MLIFSPSYNPLAVATALLLSSALPRQVLGFTYALYDSTSGYGFYNDYTFQNITDPSHGRVNYLDRDTAQSLNLSYAADGVFILRSDDTTVLDPNGPGRNAIRLQSNFAYADHLTVWDIQHMPQGLATWPSAREAPPNSQNGVGGEVVVVEGVNDIVPNLSSLHTAPGCSIPSTSNNQTGLTITTNCSANSSLVGCGVHNNKPNNFGPEFNSQGGGWYAMERTPSDINIWFWSRTDPSVPEDVALTATYVDTDNWGIPIANFPNTQCDIADDFAESGVIIDLTFCGDWAGTVFPGGIDACNDFVNNNPGAFSEAYWQFNSVSLYGTPMSTTVPVSATTKTFPTTTTTATSPITAPPTTAPATETGTQAQAGADGALSSIGITAVI